MSAAMFGKRRGDRETVAPFVCCSRPSFPRVLGGNPSARTFAQRHLDARHARGEFANLIRSRRVSLTPMDYGYRQALKQRKIAEMELAVKAD
jgi:hypothetical protein